MKRVFFGAAAALLCFSGCMKVQETVIEQYPETSGIKIYTDAAHVPYEFQVSGTCRTSGEYQDFSRDKMFAKILSKAEAAGADAVLIRGMQIVPEGSRVTTNPMTRNLNTNDPALGTSWGQMQRDFDGGYSSINKASYGTTATYYRVVHADYLRFKRTESGEFVKRDKSKPLVLPQISTSAKKESSNAKITAEKENLQDAEAQMIKAAEVSGPSDKDAPETSTK